MTQIMPLYPTLKQVQPNLWEVEFKIWMISAYTPSRIVVPVGFRTNGASVPRLFRPIMSQFDIYTSAAIIHDYLYDSHTVKTRAIADAIFLEALEYLKVGWLRRHAMYRAVRIFGGPYWSENE